MSRQRPHGASSLRSSTLSSSLYPSTPTTAQYSTVNQSPYNPAGRTDSQISITEKFSLSADPRQWGTGISPDHPEPDDYLHNPDPRRDHKTDSLGSVLTWRGFTNLGCLIVLILALVMLFAGYPIMTFAMREQQSFRGGFNLGGMNASGQVPDMPGNWGLIDKDTPESEYFRRGFFNTDDDWELIFSDEFNTDGRSFFPGDDPYWEAVDLHYWGTNNMEWYSPEMITTRDGSLVITLDEKLYHNREWVGGMMSTWNKFCFTGGMFLASVVLPGQTNVAGLWPAIWAMGNLGRAGYGASLDGTWPYSYDECDVGTVANQTVNGLPLAATRGGDASQGGVLSYLPGQRLSRCTCEGESHPGPVHADGTYVGRAAPEIDMFEAQVIVNELESFGEVSQSCQWAPFNAEYTWHNNSETLEIYDDHVSFLNTYKGAVYQQATSVVSHTNQACYEFEEGCYAVYGFEYKEGFDDAYITWINDNKAAWTLHAAGMDADPRAEIGRRPIPQEPMYLIANLGMSRNFGAVDLERLVFPTTMKVDWIRVYQRPDAINIGCDPEGFPTQAYITRYREAYSNPNLTTWVDDYKQLFPKNRFLGEC